MIKKAIIALITVFILTETCGAATPLDQPRPAISGRVSGVIIISPEDLSQFPEEAKDHVFDNELITDFPDGHREIEVSIKGWKVSTNGKSVIIQSNGYYNLQDLAPGETNVLISFKGIKIFEQKVVLIPGEKKTHDVVFRMDLFQIYKSMRESATKDGGIGALATSFPCLKNNYLCSSFIMSDCYKNLVRGNPYCWAEAVMNHPSTRWCNGTHNCSVFIGHKQSWHCDYWPW